MELDMLWNYLTGVELWKHLLAGSIRIIVILILAGIIIKISGKMIDRFFARKASGNSMADRRERTLQKLIKNAAVYIVYFMAFVMVLGVFNLEIGPLLAGAGVVGLAIGFGAQNLVRDVISGFFIIFENQFSVGDYIKVGEIEGTVEVIGLRMTKILSWTGEMHILPNGDITQVTNYSVHNGRAVVDVYVPNEKEITEAEEVISQIALSVPEKYNYIIGIPQVIGLQEIGTSEYAIRVSADTLPGYQWEGERRLRREFQEQLYKEKERPGADVSP